MSKIKLLAAKNNSILSLSNKNCAKNISFKLLTDKAACGIINYFESLIDNADCDIIRCFKSLIDNAACDIIRCFKFTQVFSDKGACEKSNNID